MSAFDTSAFLDATTTEVSIKRPPIPTGDYRAVIGELDVRQGVYKSGKKEGETYVAVDVPLTIDLPADIATSVGLTETTLKVKDGFIVDLKETGGIDYGPGKNGKLRKYREATGNNTEGRPFKMTMLTGHVVTVKIGHREYPEGSGDLFEDVVGVAAA